MKKTPLGASAFISWQMLVFFLGTTTPRFQQSWVLRHGNPLTGSWMLISEKGPFHSQKDDQNLAVFSCFFFSERDRHVGILPENIFGYLSISLPIAIAIGKFLGRDQTG